MKLQTRNHLIIFLMFISMTLLIGAAVIFALDFFTGNISLPTYNPHTKLQNFIITRMEYKAVFISIFVFLLYVFTTLLYMNINFEKTQSTEIIYLTLFLTGILFESSRLLFPLLNLWQATTDTGIIATRILLFSRILCPLSLLFTITYSSFESRQYVEQNIIILAAFSIGSASFLPLNTCFVLPEGYVQPGLSAIYLIFKYLVLGFSFIANIIKNAQEQNKFSFPWGFILMILGYMILTETYCYLMLITGTICIFCGTYTFLKKLHSQYLWT
ncbi:MAG: hypothetical protein K6F15_08180 [Treponema sp.]|nr:hypothetical protein [Treponema sp.]